MSYIALNIYILYIYIVASSRTCWKDDEELFHKQSVYYTVGRNHTKMITCLTLCSLTTPHTHRPPSLTLDSANFWALFRAIVGGWGRLNTTGYEGCAGSFWFPLLEEQNHNFMVNGQDGHRERINIFLYSVWLLPLICLMSIPNTETSCRTWVIIMFVCFLQLVLNHYSVCILNCYLRARLPALNYINLNAEGCYL